MGVNKIAMRLFGRWVRGKHYPGLQRKLGSARMPASADVYKATSMFYSVFVGLTGLLVGFFVALILGLAFPLSLAPTILIGVLFGALSYQLFIYYPAMVASERGRKIDAAMPYASTFMYALGRSGVNVAAILKELSKRPDMGELAKEAKVFLRDTEYLGRDPLTALRNLARSTPSEKFRSFLEVLISIIETGGDTTSYFATKTSEYHDIMREEQKETVTTLEFMAEIYVILVAFAPMLFLTLMIVLQFIQGIAKEMLMIIAYAWIPLGSIAFAVIIATQSRAKIGGKLPRLKAYETYDDVQIASGGKEDRRLLKQLRGGIGGARLKSAFASPFKALTHQPAYILIFSVPAALIYLLFISPVVDTSALVWTFIIGAIPYILVYEFRSRVIEKTEEALPDFLKSLGSASHSGLTLPRAIAVSSTAELGPLTDEVKRVHRDIQWGASANEALIGMEHRVRSCDTAARAVTVIRKASEAEEDVSDVIDIIKEDVETQRTLKRERKGSMFVYKLIILITFVVFLITVYLVVSSFLAMPVGTQTVGEFQVGGMDVGFFKILFYHILIIEGLFAGLLASQMGEGDLRSGLKYSVIMIIIAWVIFEYAIMPTQPKVITPEEEGILGLSLLGV